MNKEAALAQIVAIARRNELSIRDIAGALPQPANEEGEHTGGIVRRLLAYIGGIFVFAGVLVYIQMFWVDMNSAARVIVTLGSGMAALVMAIAFLDHDRLSRAATPLLLIAACLQPLGMIVAFDELGTGGDPQIAALLATGIMLLQQLLIMGRLQRTVVVFNALLFGALTIGNAFDLMGVSDQFNLMIIGLSLLLLSYGVDQTKHRSITPFWYLAGSAAFFWAVFELLRDTPVHFVYLGLSAFMIYVSTVVRSRTLLFTSTVAMIGYLAYFTAQYFLDSIGWPVALIFIGLLLLGLSSMALRINRKYIARS